MEEPRVRAPPSRIPAQAQPQLQMQTVDVTGKTEEQVRAIEKAKVIHGYVRNGIIYPESFKQPLPTRKTENIDVANNALNHYYLEKYEDDAFLKGGVRNYKAYDNTDVYKEIVALKGKKRQRLLVTIGTKRLDALMKGFSSVKGKEETKGAIEKEIQTLKNSTNPKVIKAQRKAEKERKATKEAQVKKKLEMKQALRESKMLQQLEKEVEEEIRVEALRAAGRAAGRAKLRGVKASEIPTVPRAPQTIARIPSPPPGVLEGAMDAVEKSL